MTTNTIAKAFSTEEWKKNRPEIGDEFDAGEVLSAEEKDLLSEIIDLKAEVAELEDMLEAKRQRAVKFVEELAATGQIKSFIPFSGFNFSVKTKRTFKYSNLLTHLEATLKEMKKEEVENGTAEAVKLTRYLSVTESNF